MKKSMLLLFVGAVMALSAPATSYSHCGSCGTEKKEPKKEQKACPADCKKECSKEKKCCGTEKCCKKDKKETEKKG